MKNTIRFAASLLLALSMAMNLAGCRRTSQVSAISPANGIRVSYDEDTELGQGEKTFSLTVKTDEKAVQFIVHTDRSTVGEALTELDLIRGEAGQYGLYVKTVNGVTADYDTDKTYWAFYVNGEYALSGVDTTEITEGAEYQLVREK